MHLFKTESTPSVVTNVVVFYLTSEGIPVAGAGDLLEPLGPYPLHLLLRVRVEGAVVQEPGICRQKMRNKIVFFLKT
jgi:hypothetical protein